ncbi:hypothetical protein [Serratia fonticola]
MATIVKTLQLVRLAFFRDKRNDLLDLFIAQQTGALRIFIGKVAL